MTWNGETICAHCGALCGHTIMKATWRSDRFPDHEHRCPKCAHVVRCQVRDCQGCACPRCYKIATEGLDALIRLDAWLLPEKEKA